MHSIESSQPCVAPCVGADVSRDYEFRGVSAHGASQGIARFDRPAAASVCTRIPTGRHSTSPCPFPSSGRTRRPTPGQPAVRDTLRAIEAELAGPPGVRRRAGHSRPPPRLRPAAPGGRVPEPAAHPGALSGIAQRSVSANRRRRLCRSGGAGGRRRGRGQRGPAIPANVPNKVVSWGFRGLFGRPSVWSWRFDGRFRAWRELLNGDEAH